MIDTPLGAKRTLALQFRITTVQPTGVWGERWPRLENESGGKGESLLTEVRTGTQERGFRSFQIKFGSEPAVME